MRSMSFSFMSLKFRSCPIFLRSFSAPKACKASFRDFERFFGVTNLEKLESTSPSRSEMTIMRLGTIYSAEMKTSRPSIILKGV